MNLTQPVKPSVPDVLPMVKAYCAKNHTGYSLHAVLDDGNIRDSDIAWCLKRAEENGDSEGARIAKLLALMSRTQREKITSLCWIGVP